MDDKGPATEPWLITYPAPFSDWLTDNHIDPERTPQWPQLTIEGGVIRIEQWWFADDASGDCPTGSSVVIHDEQARVMREFPLEVPMSADLASAWELMAERGRREQAIRHFATETRGSRINFMAAHHGDHLLLIIPGADDATRKAFTASIADLLPGVQVTVAVGVSAVVAIQPSADGPVAARGSLLTVAARLTGMPTIQA